MNICLINPAYAKVRSEGEDYYYSGFTLPHLGLGYIAAYLEKNGYIVDVYECMGQDISINEMIEILLKKKYDIIGISIYEGNKKDGFRIINDLAKTGSKSFVFAGGYTATLSSEQILRAYPSINCCVLGEGEQTILELVNKLAKEQDYKTTRGIAYLENGQYIKTEKQNLIQKLDDLPFPKRVFMNRNRIISMISSRGCNGNCIFCSIVSLYRNCKGKIYRNRSAQNVVEEIEYLISQYNNIKNICFFDDNFLENTPENNKKIIDLVALFKEKNLFIPFSITSCARDIIRMRSVLCDLKSIGLYSVFIGVESFVQRQLDFYNKNTTVEENMLAIEIVKDIGLELSLGLIAFDPYVSLDEVELNFRSLKRMKVTNSGLTPFSLHTYLIAVRGTTFMNALVNEKKYVPNQRGYLFESAEVSQVVEYVELWNKATNQIVSKSYLIESLQDKGDFQRAKILREIYGRYIDLDIDYIIGLCMAKKSGLSIEDVFNGFYKNYQTIFDQFMSNSTDAESITII